MGLALSILPAAPAGRTLKLVKLKSEQLNHFGVTARRFKVGLHGAPPFKFNTTSTHFIFCIICYCTRGIHPFMPQSSAA
jgi:hypothetical protein